MILEEYDETINSTFDPYEVENVIEGFPKTGVTCFSKKLFDQLVNKFNGIEIAQSSMVMVNFQYIKLIMKEKTWHYLCL